MAEVEELRQQIEGLREELQRKEKDLHMAGVIGNELLVKNEELSAEMEKNSLECATRVESLEQEKYSLQLKASQKANLEAEYTEDLESLKSTITRLKEEHQTVMDTEIAPKISGLKQQVSGLHQELEKQQLIERQLRESLEQQESTLEDYKQQLERKMDALNETCGDEMAQLHADINRLQSEKLELTSELTESRNTCQQGALAVSALKEQLTLKGQEVEERQCQATSYFNALERSREDNQELKVELDMLRLETQDTRAKGNSLFSEVEDKRVEAEKRLITLTVKYESIQKQHEFARQQLQKMKMQMATLLMMAGGHADHEQMDRQQLQLSNAQDEIKTLLEKIAEMEKQEKLERREMQVASASGDKKYEYLLTLVERKENEVDEVKKELNSTRLMQLAESQRLILCQRQLHTSEKEAERLQGALMKTRVKLDEMKLKYEPDSLKGCNKNRVIYEKIPPPKLKEVAEEQEEKESETKENNDDNPQEQTSLRRKRVTLAGRPLVEEQIPTAGSKGGSTSKSCLKDTVGKKSFVPGQHVPTRGTVRQLDRNSKLTNEDCKVQ